MAAHKGHKKAGGRQKGTGNKLTADIRQMVINTLHKAGGEKYLYTQAIQNPQLFMPLVAKMMPQHVNVGGQKDNPLIISTPVEAKKKWDEMREQYDKRVIVIDAKPCEPQSLP